MNEGRSVGSKTPACWQTRAWASWLYSAPRWGGRGEACACVHKGLGGVSWVGLMPVWLDAPSFLPSPTVSPPTPPSPPPTLPQGELALLGVARGIPEQAASGGVWDWDLAAAAQAALSAQQQEQMVATVMDEPPPPAVVAGE